MNSGPVNSGPVNSGPVKNGSSEGGPAERGPVAGGRAGSRLDGQPPVFLAAPGDLRGDVVVLTGAEGRHASTVRRLATGERVDVTDGAGLTAECVVVAARPGELELAVVARRVDPPPEPSVVVVQALPKGDRGQLAVELMTEVGVDVIVPWAAERCVTRWHGERGERSLERWRATAREAAKQSRRSRLPEVRPLAATTDVAGLVTAAALALVLDPAGAVTLAGLAPPSSGAVVLIVGPEGGVSPAETAALSGAGALTARIGGTVLRTSSAGVVAAAVVLSRCGRWG